MSDTQQWASARRRFSGEWVLRERDEKPLELTSEAHLTRNRKEPP